ncbi:MAG TPA: glycosyltransferase [Planctomycetaceae bacterium]|nr:glycosyltransferase [Planctomycetaceae bacterium]HIQ20218.1 glycosyltransferase [Planctomycetota bacterium]
MSQNIGFISTRFAGTDGVSLESAKWARILWDHKHISYWYAGKLDRDPAVSMLVPEAYFYHPDNVWINQRVFGTRVRRSDVTRKIFEVADFLKGTLYEFVEKFSLDMLVVQNALCIPMHIPLGVALTHFIAETGIPTIAHHHDFYWERPRFSVNAVEDILTMAFPPTLPSIAHATINSFARQDLAWRKGLSSVLVPNVLDFEGAEGDPPRPKIDFREHIGLEPDDIMILQPTRVVPRKGIEHSIALVSQLRNPRCKLIVSHETGDEGQEYHTALIELAEQSGVDLRFVYTEVRSADPLATTGAASDDGISLADVYAQADLITYPSLYEGFGNALLEAFYFRKPVLVNRYAIFISDIEPKGFRVVAMNGFLTRSVLEEVRRVIEDHAYRQEMVDRNFQLGKQFFSYSVLRRKLRSLITHFTGLDDL